MKALIFKDFITMKKSVKNLIYFIAMFGLFTFTMDSPAIAGMIVVVGSMLVTNAFSYDEHSKFDRYVLTLPISKKKIVLSKYLLAGIFLLLSNIITLVLLIISQAVKGSVDISFILGTIYGVDIAATFLISLLIPLIYKSGIENSRYLLMGVSIAIILVVLGAGYVISLFNTLALSSILKYGIYFSPILILPMIIISYYISVKIYVNKEI